MQASTTNENLIRAILGGSRAAEEQLYRALYGSLFAQLVPECASETEAGEVFADAFIVFLEKLRNGSFHSLINTVNGGFAARAHAFFERILWRQFYHPNRSVYRAVSGAKTDNPYAKEHLGAWFKSGHFAAYARQLMEQFDVRAMEAADFVEESIADLLENIRNGDFTLEPDAPNDLNKNRLAKYFKRIIFNKIGKWKARRGKTGIKPPGENLPADCDEEIAEPAPGFRDALQWQIAQLMAQLGDPCYHILRESYVRRKSPKEIAKTGFHPGYRTTDQVREKKYDCLQRLHRDFINRVEQYDPAALEQIAGIARHAVDHLEEPCRTILTHYLSPRKTSMAEIAAALRDVLPPPEAENLQTPEQVKRRRYKCMIPLYDQLWNTVFSPNRFNGHGTSL